MKAIEIEGDLFDLPNVFETGNEDDYYYVHCIASDYAMGAGIAVPMAKRFNLRKEFDSMPGRILEYPAMIFVNGVFNMFTKERSFHKPKYEDFFSALVDVAIHCEENNIKKLAMPRIGCGLDGLKWEIVWPLIQDTFEHLDIEIVAVDFK